MSKIHYQLSALVGIMVLLISCAAVGQSTSASPSLFTNCPLVVQGNLTNAISRATPAPPPQSRHLVFISDLHMGVGKDQSGKKWHPYEDFRWEKEFKLFLTEINRIGEGKTDLILNGDTFELWQSANDDCRYQNKNLGCGESDALKRAKRVIDSHASELGALGEFADSGNNRVIILPGNHDAVILFPAVKKAVLDSIKSTKARVAVLDEGYWLSVDQRIYVEHGHQIGRQVNCFQNWPAPFVEQAGVKYLQRPWGEEFVQDYYNRYETKYRIIDNIEGESAGIRYGLAAEGPLGLAEGVRTYFKFLLFQESWEQFAGALGEKEGLPTWDVERIRNEQGNTFLVESMPADDPFRAAAAEALQGNKLPLSLSDLSDEEIVEICDRRTAQKKAGKNITECPHGSLGAATDILRQKNTIFGQHLENTYRLLALSGKTQRRFEIFLFGHTHTVEKFYPLKENWNPVVINMGAWQRVVSPKQLEDIKRVEKLSDNQVLATLEPEQLPACYSFVTIKPYSQEQGPNPNVSYWRENKKGEWGFSGSCDWVPKTGSGK